MGEVYILLRLQGLSFLSPESIRGQNRKITLVISIFFCSQIFLSYDTERGKRGLGKRETEIFPVCTLEQNQVSHHTLRKLCSVQQLNLERDPWQNWATIRRLTYTQQADLCSALPDPCFMHVLEYLKSSSSVVRRTRRGTKEVFLTVLHKLNGQT